MKIGINAVLLSDPSLRGWNRYTVNLLAELPGQGVELVLYSRAPVFEGHLARLPAGSFQTRVDSTGRYLNWEQRRLPKLCEQDGVQVLHSPFNYGLPWSCPCPMVLTLHDAIEFIYYGKRASWRSRWSRGGLQTRLMHWVARSRADRIITVSEHAKKDLAGFLRLPADRIDVILEAADPSFGKPVAPHDRQSLRERHHLRKPFIFYIGGWEERKNIPCLVRGFAASGINDVELVLAGGKDEQRADLVALAQSLGVDDRLRLLGWITDEELPVLFAEALCFVYPSVYEGFGLQICEAMAMGCPTLASNVTSLPEVLGDGGETFDPNDPETLGRLLRRVAEESSFRAELADRAKRRSAVFSWRKAAEETAAVYRRVIAQTGSA
ncbi:MAG: glycosyltransferase family 1 protein [Isosphaeraceae bacterium]